MVEIGLAQPADVPVLCEIERRAADLFRAHPQTALLTLSSTPLSPFIRAQEAGMLWVARSEMGPVGFALVEDFGTSLHLEELDVAPEHGRQGVGRRLVRAVCEEATARERPVTLCTFRDVAWNAPLYERLGFVRLSPDELAPALQERVQQEAQRGLSPDIRVVMQFDARRRPTACS